jgi:hypothetical protein
MASFHNDALQTLYSSVTERASAQSHIPLHSPGSAAQKTVDGKTYTYWRVYMASGKHKETSLGRTGEPATAAALDARLLESAEMRVLATDVQVLRKAKFAAADNSSALTLATLFNAGIFSHGGVLDDSHAFGALLNSLGVRLPANYRPEDIDIGSTGTISVAIPEDRSFLDILRDSGIPFLEVPELDSRNLRAHGLLGSSLLRCRGFLRNSLRDRRFRIGRRTGANNQKLAAVFRTSKPRRRRTTSAPCRSGFCVTVKRRLRTFPLPLATSRTDRLRPLFGRSLCLAHNTCTRRDRRFSAACNQEFASVFGFSNPGRRAGMTAPRFAGLGIDVFRWQFAHRGSLAKRFG